MSTRLITVVGLCVSIGPLASQIAWAGDSLALQACKERDAALERLDSTWHEYDAVYQKTIRATTAQAKETRSASQKKFDVFLSHYYEADDRCNALSLANAAGKSNSTNGNALGSGQRPNGRSVFVDAVPSGNSNQSGARQCRIPSLRLCHDVCNGEYGMLCMWGQVCDPDNHTCEKTSP